MKPVAVLWATREGHTQRIAERVVASFRERSLDAIAFKVGRMTVDLNTDSAVVLAASVHAGRHEREMIEFVREHREQLRSTPNAFLSVTLSEAGAERKDTTTEEHERFVDDVRNMIDRFVSDTGWHPNHAVPIAGALRYSRYNLLVRLLMKRIARQAGGSSDTSRDYEYTDWKALDEFIGQFADEVKRASTANESPSS